MVVLGTGDDGTARDFDEIRDALRGHPLRRQVLRSDGPRRLHRRSASSRPSANAKLCGCENVGSRPFQHLHITPHAECVLCCEDYDEKHVVGDLNTESVAEVLSGARFSLLRTWVYGVEEAPADFICRGCVFALNQ